MKRHTINTPKDSTAERTPGSLHPVVRHPAKIRIQWKPNLIAAEKRICLTRIRWERGNVGDGNGYSCKLSISLIFEPRDIWVGLFYSKRDSFTKCWWVCLLPCLPIRIKLLKSWGGIFP